MRRVEIAITIYATAPPPIIFLLIISALKVCVIKYYTFHREIGSNVTQL